MDELERNFPGIGAAVKGLPAKIASAATTVPRGALAVGARSLQDRTLPLVAGVNMATEALTPAVGDAMVAGQTNLGFPDAAMAEARRTQQLLNPRGMGVVPTTIVPQVATAVPAVVSGVLGAATPQVSAPDTSRRLPFGPAGVADTARRLPFGPAETPFFTNVPAVAEARGLRERADLPGVFGNIQGDFGVRGGGLSFASNVPEPPTVGGVRPGGPEVPAAPEEFTAADLLRGRSTFTPEAFRVAQGLATDQSNRIERGIRRQERARGQDIDEFTAETGRINAAVGLRNALSRTEKVEDKFGMTPPTSVYDPVSGETISKPGSIKVGDVERPIESPEEYQDLHGVAARLVQLRRQSRIAQGLPPMDPKEEDQIYRQALEDRWLQRRVATGAPAETP
jgi:hypothetical protein